jgi:feruloyl esterase
MDTIRWGAALGSVGLLLMAGCGGGDDPPPVAADPKVATVDCASLAALQLPNTTILSAQAIPAGNYKPPGSTSTFSDLPAFCRVVARVSPVPDSAIGIEVWLPTRTWNGKYQQVGNHSFGGNIFWNEMAPQLRRGYATAATDDGHTPGGFGVDWGFGHPEKVVDVAWRAIHETSAKAKLLIAGYYSRAAKFAYYNGCSNGGRGGMKSAQVSPDDFDGIIAGGAAQYWTPMATYFMNYSKNVRAAGIQGAAGTAVLNQAQKAAIAACDATDGVTDGIVSDPSRCGWSPQSLVCTAGQDASTCITQAQADALGHNLETLVHPTTGAFIMSGMARASEFDQIRFNFLEQNLYGLNNYRLALNDPTWDGSTFDLARDSAILDRELGVMNAFDPDLSRFKAAGKKLIQYHGWGDAAFTPGATTRYYGDVVATTGKGDVKAVQDFYRLFMVPGSGHCLGAGPGPDNIGAENQIAVSNDPEHDILSALEAWVEQGVAPQRLIATKFVNPAQPEVGIVMQRPLCPYPSEAVYKGAGDTSDPANFSCQVR